MKNVGITVFGCEKDEAKVLHELSPRFGVESEIVSITLEAYGTMPICGN